MAAAVATGAAIATADAVVAAGEAGATGAAVVADDRPFPALPVAGLSPAMAFQGDDVPPPSENWRSGSRKATNDDQRRSSPTRRRPRCRSSP
jgi:hypothetical protein